MSNETTIKADKTANKNTTLLDQCHRYRVSVKITNILEVLFMVPSDKFGAWHFYGNIRDSFFSELLWIYINKGIICEAYFSH